MKGRDDFGNATPELTKFIDSYISEETDIFALHIMQKCIEEDIDPIHVISAIHAQFEIMRIWHLTMTRSKYDALKRDKPEVHDKLISYGERLPLINAGHEAYKCISSSLEEKYKK